MGDWIGGNAAARQWQVPATLGEGRRRRGVEEEAERVGAEDLGRRVHLDGGTSAGVDAGGVADPDEDYANVAVAVLQS